MRVTAVVAAVFIALFGDNLEVCAARPSPSSSVSSSASAPNVVLVIADDAGFNDFSFHGSEIQTPFLDSLALGNHSVHLANYYGQSICTPARSCIMTGRYASHTGMQHSYWMQGQAGGLPLGFATIGDHFKDLNYSTHFVGGFVCSCPVQCSSNLPAAVTPPRRRCCWLAYCFASRDHHHIRLMVVVFACTGGWVGAWVGACTRIGKWHLGFEDWNYTAVERGFDSYFGCVCFCP